MKGWCAMSNNRSRHARRTRQKKKSGAAGIIIALVVVVLIAVIVLIFVSDSSYKGVKGKVYSVVYPQKYEIQVSKYAKEFHVEEPLVYAVIRTESNFQQDVESHAGAIGLMQLMPETFDWLQEKLEGEVIYTTDALNDPDVNIRYGTYLLSYLLEQYDNNQETAIAAYNAGTSAVDEWLSDSSCSPDGKTLTQIPYEETSEYVARVTNAYEKYKLIYYS